MSKQKLSREEKSVIRRLFWRSGLLFGSFNMVKMQGQGYAYTMAPVIDKYYKDQSQKVEAFKRSNEYFNCNSTTAGLIYGINYALEKQKSEGTDIDGSTITSIKTALMGPLSGVGDAIIFNTLRVIIASIAISFCELGNPIGLAIFIIMFGGLSLLLRYVLIQMGYVLGASSIEKIFGNGMLGIITKAASTLGLIMIGAMVASSVNITLGMEWSFGGSKVVIQEILDSILPGILSLITLGVVIKLLKKRISPNTIVIGMLIFCILMAALGVF